MLKTDDVVDVDEVGKTSYNRGKHWHFSRCSHVESSKGLDKNVLDQYCDGKTYDKGRRAQGRQQKTRTRRKLVAMEMQRTTRATNVNRTGADG